MITHMDFYGFLIGTVSNALASFIVFLLLSFFSTRMKNFLWGFFSRALGLDVEMIYPNFDKAKEDIAQKLNLTAFIKYVCCESADMPRINNPIPDSSNRVKNIKILLPGTRNYSNIWVNERAKEIKKFNQNFNERNLTDLINETAKAIENHGRANRIELRRYKSPSLARILITERCAFLVPYNDYEDFKNTKVIKYRRNSQMYEFLTRYFDTTFRSVKHEPA